MYHSNIEALETRIAPAGLGVADIYVDATDLIVSLSGGLLKVGPKPGATNLDVSISLLPDGSFLISDGSGDDDLEEVPNFSGLVRSISASLSNGDDHLAIDLDADFTLGGNVSINTSLGDDQVEVSEAAIRGNLAIASKGSNEVFIGGGPVNIRGVLSSVANGGSFHFGDDAKAGTLNASGAGDFILGGLVAGNAALSAKAGDASFQIGGLPGGSVGVVGGNLTITGVAGSDDVFVGHSMVRGALSFNLGAGNNLTTITTDSIVVGIARINGTLGDDTVQLGTIGAGGPLIHGRLSLSLGSGNNTFNAYSGMVSGGLGYTGTTGVDSVLIGAGVTLYADAKIAAGDGANVIAVETFSSLWKFNLSTGIGADTVTLATAGAGYVNGTVALGNGIDDLTIAGTADFFSTFKVDGGLAADTLTVNVLVLGNGLTPKGFETVI